MVISLQDLVPVIAKVTGEDESSVHLREDMTLESVGITSSLDFIELAFEVGQHFGLHADLHKEFDANEVREGHVTVGDLLRSLDRHIEMKHEYCPRN